MDIADLIAARPSARRQLASWYSGLIDAAEREGLTVAELAAKAGVVKETIYSWRRRRARTTTSARMKDGPPGLVQVRVVEEAPSPLHGPALELRLGRRRRILVPAGFDRDTLMALVTALDQC